MLLTRTPLYLGTEAPFRVRLACVRHAASVDSEPGSNSQLRDPSHSRAQLEVTVQSSVNLCLNSLERLGRSHAIQFSKIALSPCLL